jgi:hypothetical protein
VWRRWSLAPGIELHVRDDASARHGRLIRRLRRVAAEACEPADLPPPPDGDGSLDQA